MALAAATVVPESVTRSEVTCDRPLVSVVVSTRNHSRFLAGTIAGVMGQDLAADFEMIVVDDASTDSTPEVMRQALAGATHHLVYARLDVNRGPACGRNAGLELARGQYIAFTDSDCTPAPGWLRAGLAAFTSPDIGIVQGRTEGARDRAPFFSHYIETRHFDGSFSTSNVLYRREAIGDLRFDPECTYNHEGRPDSNFFWEDTDLGWRVSAMGWKAVFADGALVYHEILTMSARRWILWPRHLALMPAKAARYPGFRRHLFLRTWISPIHLFFDLALVGVVAAPWMPLALLLATPYAVTFARTRGLRGKFPPAKVAAYLAWDSVALGALAAASIRYRRLVL